MKITKEDLAKCERAMIDGGVAPAVAQHLADLYRRTKQLHVSFSVSALDLATFRYPDEIIDYRKAVALGSMMDEVKKKMVSISESNTDQGRSFGFSLEVLAPKNPPTKEESR